MTNLSRVKRAIASAALLLFATQALATDPFTDFRGLWISRFDFNEDSASSIQNQINRAADMGITDVIWQVRGKADAYYNSNFEPNAEDWQGFVDPLQTAIDTAHNRGLKLHAWINTMPIWRDTTQPNDPSHIFYNSNPSFRVTDINGNIESLPGGSSSFSGNYARVNHVLPEVQNHINNVVNDLATNYDVDGIHLDYIRWLGPSSQDGFQPTWDQLPHDALSHQIYFNETGQNGADGSTLAKRNAYREWVKGKITELVETLDVTIDAAEVSEGRQIDFSAAVWNNPSTAENTYLQDYRTWLENDTFDIMIPMVYLRQSNNNLLDGFLNDIFSTQTNTHISVGLGSYLHTPAEGGVAETIDQMQRVYDNGNADSLTFFAYGSLLDGSSLSNQRRDAVVDWYDALNNLPGDFNDDGIVDAADYTIWRDNWLSFGAPGDADGDGFVGNSDYDIWAANFGQTLGSSSNSESSAVPEPSAVLLAVLALCAMKPRKRN